MSLRLERMMGIDAKIRSKQYPSIQTFMEMFEVSERTIHADLAFLRDRLKAPLVYSRTNGGYYYSDLTWNLPTLMMSEGEILAFFLSVELARRYLGTSFEAPLRKTVEHIATMLPEQHRIELSELAQNYTFQAGAISSSDPALLSELFEAMHQCWPVKISYFTASRGERNQRIIEPYHLYNVRGDWQVIAFDHLRQQPRNFAVSRIEAWEVLKQQRFKRDPSFSPTSYLSTAFLAERGEQNHTITIWFDAYQANYIRGRTIHASQIIEEHDDGSLILHFESGALDEIKRWVMSFGRHALVKQPLELALEIEAELNEMLKIYREQNETATLLQSGLIE